MEAELSQVMDFTLKDVTICISADKIKAFMYKKGATSL